MATCNICKAKIPTTFMGKIVGTIVYDDNHKKLSICSNCQQEHQGKLKEQLRSE